jgi:polyisoprenoid-binding protein YceI
MNTSKRLILAALTGIAIFAALPAVADTYDIDTAHSSVAFEVRHLAISKARGTFTDFTGNFDFTAGDPAAWSCEATIQAASINTDNEDRDEHLRSPDFLETEKFPTLTFVSKAVEMAGENEGILRGELTLHGVTQVVEFDLEFLGAVTDPWGNEKAGFTATTKINRKDFGLTWSKTLETGGLVVGDEVKITLDVEGAKRK